MGAGAAGVPQTVCKMMGRWAPTIDQAYDRSIKAQITKAQGHIARFAQRNLGREDPFDGSSVMAAISDKMDGLNVKVEDVQRQLQKLRTFRKGGRPASSCNGWRKRLEAQARLGRVDQTRKWWRPAGQRSWTRRSVCHQHRPKVAVEDDA